MIKLISFDTDWFKKDYKRMMKFVSGRNDGDCHGADCLICPLNVIDCTDKENSFEIIQIVSDWANNNPEAPPEIDWAKVPVDTEVRVWEKGRQFETRRFAMYLPGGNKKFLCFPRGLGRNQASFTRSWKYCELVNPEDIKKYRKNSAPRT